MAAVCSGAVPGGMCLANYWLDYKFTEVIIRNRFNYPCSTGEHFYDILYMSSNLKAIDCLIIDHLSVILHVASNSLNHPPEPGCDPFSSLSAALDGTSVKLQCVV